MKLQGTLSPYTNDQFMASLNTVTTPSTTPGRPGGQGADPAQPEPWAASRRSNPPAPAAEDAGDRREVRAAHVRPVAIRPGVRHLADRSTSTSRRCVQSNTVYGFVAVPNAQIPRDLNIVSFRMNSQYLRPGCLGRHDRLRLQPGNPADRRADLHDLDRPDGAPLRRQLLARAWSGTTRATCSSSRPIRSRSRSISRLQQPGALQHRLSTVTDRRRLPDPALTPALDFYDEYVWSSRGATQEVKHTYTTTYEEVLTTGNSSTPSNTLHAST